MSTIAAIPVAVPAAVEISLTGKESVTDKFFCHSCLQEFQPSRNDARTCSPKCRKRLHRGVESRSAKRLIAEHKTLLRARRRAAVFAAREKVYAKRHRDRFLQFDGRSADSHAATCYDELPKVRDFPLSIFQTDEEEAQFNLAVIAAQAESRKELRREKEAFGLLKRRPIKTGRKNEVRPRTPDLDYTSAFKPVEKLPVVNIPATPYHAPCDEFECTLRACKEFATYRKREKRKAEAAEFATATI
jgi:hypothetical protein